MSPFNSRSPALPKTTSLSMLTEPGVALIAAASGARRLLAPREGLVDARVRLDEGVGRAVEDDRRLEARRGIGKRVGGGVVPIAGVIRHDGRARALVAAPDARRVVGEAGGRRRADAGAAARAPPVRPGRPPSSRRWRSCPRRRPGSRRWRASSGWPPSGRGSALATSRRERGGRRTRRRRSLAPPGAGRCA